MDLQQIIFNTKNIYIILLILLIIVIIKIYSNIFALKDKMNFKNIWKTNKIYFLYIVILIILDVGAMVRGF